VFPYRKSVASKLNNFGDENNFSCDICREIVEAPS
jgi:hypothetical protein